MLDFIYLALLPQLFFLLSEGNSSCEVVQKSVVHLLIFLHQNFGKTNYS